MTDIFQRLVEGELDVAGLGMTHLLRTFDLDDPPFLAPPVFPNRNFRHLAIFVHTDGGITAPEDLVGKVVSEFALYGRDSGVWPKDILADEYGVAPDRSRWVVGGTNQPFPSLDWIPQPVPDGAPGITRLSPDHGRAERDYHRRTGIFPMMHAVAIRKELAGHARAVFDALSQAKEITADRYRDGAVKQHMAVMTPWFSELFAENRRLLGEDRWPYGLRANRTAVDTFLRCRGCRADC